MTFMRLFSLLLPLSLLGACSPSTGGPHVVNLGDDGKADNYISSNAREFDLVGAAHVAVPDGYDALSAEEKEAALDRAVSTRLSAISRAVNSHIREVLKEGNGDLTGDDVKFFTYSRSNNTEAAEVELVDEAWAKFDFTIALVGSPELLDMLTEQGNDARSFQVEVPVTGDEVPEPVEIGMRGSSSVDAFPQYDELFADGIYDIGVHFGGDYNEERYDLETAKWLVEYLLEEGWVNQSGVENFDDLKIDSGAFVRSMTVEGRPVEAQIFISHSDMVEADNEQPLRDVVEESFRSRDVIFYSGHAGPNAGFILDYQPKFEIDNNEFKDLEMRDEYQIIVLDGCETYRTYVNDIMENPNKTFQNTDIVTTVNTTPFSAGYQTLFEFVNWLTITDEAGNHFPVSWMTILQGINTEDFMSVHYGVHGIDMDPQLNPNGSVGVACSPCVEDSDCAGGGNFCLEIDGVGACGVACTSDDACGAGSRCARVFDEEDFHLPKQCVPRDQSCG